MIFQLMASFLMIIALEIYHGYDKGDPSLATISQVLQFKNVAIVSLYLSRFLSGCSAGKSTTYIQRLVISFIQVQGVSEHQSI